MTTFSRSDDLRGATFVGADLRGARFVEADLSGVVMRGAQVEGLDIDAPWLPEGPLLVNGVDVVPYVEAELNRLFPGRERRRASDPAGLRAAWTVLQQTWEATMARAASLPSDAVHVSVGGEWSFAQTLRHLVLATDTWLGRAIRRLDQPFHPLGLAGPQAAEDGLDLSVFRTDVPTYDEVLAARTDRVALVTDYLATVTANQLDEPRNNPWAPQYPETVRSCLQVILEEEWEHHRFAVRDLTAIEAGG